MYMRWSGLLLAWFMLLPSHASRKFSRASVSRSSLTITTSNAQARKLFEAGMLEYENDHTEQALANWHSALHKDPNFALAWLFTSEASEQPKEQKTARVRAAALAGRVTAGEKLLIKWFVDAQEERYVNAIVAMNDLLARYPSDKRLAFLAGHWLSDQGQYGPAATHLQRAIELDPNYAAAWNELAFCYAYNGDYSHAFSAMERYVALLPKDPNPLDSYAEILRMAGNFRSALDHYQQALQIDPNFRSAQLGIADTYALMGEEAMARRQYEKAMAEASSPADKTRYALQSAITYVREKKHGKAASVLTAVAKEAHDSALPLLEAEAFRVLALNEHEDRQALAYLDHAESALADAKAPRTDVDVEEAEVLRVRAVRAESAGLHPDAAKALQRMQALADNTHADGLRRAYAGARGSVLMVDQKYAEAIPFLQEEPDNPLSIQHLIVAYTHTGANDRAHVLELNLAMMNQPTIEQALVVPDLRTRLAATTEKRGWLRKLLPLSQ
jgi:Tfp pilus assembly protein PilF